MSAAPQSIADAVYAALSRQLNLSAEDLRRREREGLDALGLDSHGLLRVLLDIERDLALSTSIELPDDALESPATLVAGVAAITGSR